MYIQATYYWHPYSIHTILYIKKLKNNLEHSLTEMCLIIIIFFFYEGKQCVHNRYGQTLYSKTYGVNNRL